MSRDRPFEITVYLPWSRDLELLGKGIMPADSGLTPPGSSTYASNTLHVGDGTWDTGRDTFLLPNLMGLNFETMQYNGGYMSVTKMVAFRFS